jgi:hypothetical protein
MTPAHDSYGAKVNDVLSDEVSGGWTLAMGAADLDGDLLPELYLANDFGPDRLLHNRSTTGHLRFAVLEGRRDFTTPKGGSWLALLSGAGRRRVRAADASPAGAPPRAADAGDDLDRRFRRHAAATRDPGPGPLQPHLLLQ